MNSDLTIISVYHSDKSREFLELNEQLARTFNSGRSWEWVAVNNTPLNYTGAHASKERFTLCKGIPQEELKDILEPWQWEMRGSYHHMMALYKAFPLVKTRYALILDGDFYLIYPHWVREVLAYIKAHNLALLGPPWHPRWWKKARYFPIHHALFIDTEKLPLASLDLMPTYKGPDDFPNLENRERGIAWSKNIPFIQTLMRKLAQRAYIGASRDAWYAMHRKYYRSSLRYELLTPVHNPFVGMPSFIKIIKQIFRIFIPDRLSYVPYPWTYTTRSFKDRGYFDAAGQGWGEFLGQGKPFGVHLRSTPGRAVRNRDEELLILTSGLEMFTRSNAL